MMSFLDEKRVEAVGLKPGRGRPYTEAEELERVAQSAELRAEAVGAHSTEEMREVTRRAHAMAEELLKEARDNVANLTVDPSVVSANAQLQPSLSELRLPLPVRRASPGLTPAPGADVLLLGASRNHHCTGSPLRKLWCASRHLESGGRQPEPGSCRQLAPLLSPESLGWGANIWARKLR